jgi:hypothetical protein
VRQGPARPQPPQQPTRERRGAGPVSGTGLLCDTGWVGGDGVLGWGFGGGVWPSTRDWTASRDRVVGGWAGDFVCGVGGRMTRSNSALGHGD